MRHQDRKSVARNTIITFNPIHIKKVSFWHLLLYSLNKAAAIWQVVMLFGCLFSITFWVSTESNYQNSILGVWFYCESEQPVGNWVNTYVF